MYYTYVLSCQNNDDTRELYIGSCTDLKIRIDDHIKKQVKTTRKFDRITMVYYEACLSKSDAIKREKQLKTGFGRGYLKRRLEDSLGGIE